MIQCFPIFLASRPQSLPENIYRESLDFTRQNKIVVNRQKYQRDENVLFVCKIDVMDNLKISRKTLVYIILFMYYIASEVDAL